MAPWHLLEAWAVQQLLRTPAFHRAVEKVARQVHRVRHGLPADEPSGTRIDEPSGNDFMKHFVDEVKTQLGAAERKEADAGRKNVAVYKEGADAQSGQPAQTADESADAVWQNAQHNAAQAPKQGFLGEYMSALREQVKANSSGK